MYDKYFHSKVIDKALGTDEYTDETMESYMFRIINLTNKNTNLSSLNGLREIWNTIDLKNISRLKSTGDSFEVATEVLHTILNNLQDAEVKVDEEGNESYEPAQDSGQGSDMSGGGSGSSSSNLYKSSLRIIPCLANASLGIFSLFSIVSLVNNGKCLTPSLMAPST